MIDTHAHIDTKPFNEDRNEMLQRAWDAGIEAIIIPDIQVDRREHLKKVVASDARLFRGVGIHPHHVGEITQNDIDEVERESHEQDVVAIGEIGLDYHYDFCPVDTQKSYFRMQVEIARERGLPIIVHNRESDEDVLSIIKEVQDGSLRGVLHCFSSDVDILHRALDLGMNVSFTGNITFKRSTLDDVVRSVPMDRFMVETDSPYITPVPNRGKRNEPSYVGLIAQKIAEIKNMTMEEIRTASSKTARALFALSLAFIALTAVALAQPEYPVDEEYETDYEWEIAVENYYADSVAYEKWIRPRKLGIGITVGTNTTVELQKFTQRFEPTFIEGVPREDPRRWTTYEKDQGPKRSFSFEGLTSFGATVTYGLFTQLVLEGTYIFTQNTKPAEQFGLDPITTNIVELAALYNVNPNSKVNFLPQLGFTFSNSDDGTESFTKFGINVGMGIAMNVPTDIGLFYPMINVRFNFMLGTDNDKVVQKYIDPETGQTSFNSINPQQESVDLADVNTIFSIPRLTILYYIP